MLTWAIVYYSVKSNGYNGLWFMASIIGDVMICYYIACAATGHKP